jgi:uncharacterized coiled-coil DUF342 family protein
MEISTEISIYSKKRKANNEEIIEDLKSDIQHLSENISKLKKDKDRAIQSNNKYRNDIVKFLHKIDSQEIELDAADIRVRDLEISNMDLQESNSTYAIKMQHSLATKAHMDSELYFLRFEAANSIERHIKEMFLIVSEKKKFQDESMILKMEINDLRHTSKIIQCNICVKENCKNFTALVCGHVICSECRNNVTLVFKKNGTLY